jgi:hypothetical protein
MLGGRGGRGQRGQRAEGRGQRTEDRGQRAEDSLLRAIAATPAAGGWREKGKLGVAGAVLQGTSKRLV